MSFATPLRAIPMFQPASALRQIAPLVQRRAASVQTAAPGRAWHILTARELAQTTLANAQAGLREAVRVYDLGVR